MTKKEARCEQISRLPGHAAERERCGDPVRWYCPNCDKELCTLHATYHQSKVCQARPGVRRSDGLEGFAMSRPAPAERWEPCAHCDTRGYTTEQVDVDMENRYPCPECHGEGEVKVEEEATVAEWQRRWSAQG